MTKQNDGLFLLEVLIDKIVFVKSPCFSDKDFRTCVNIQCPGVEPLEICDDEPGACIAKSNGPFIKSFNNGKSCLFSLTESDIATAMNKYPIKVSVYKSLPCGCLPTKIIMGECEIDMTKEFVEARKTFLEDPTNVSYQALKDSFRIVGADGSESGEIVMFLRISCFGKLIITRFQGPGGPPNLGAGKRSAIVDRSCTPNKDFQSLQDPCVCGAARSTASGGMLGQSCNVGGSGVCPPARDPYNSIPCEDPDDPCYCSGPKPQPKQQMVCRNTDQYCLHVPKDCCPTGNKVVFQIPSDSCDLGHKQRAHFNFTSDGVGELARDEPGQLMPTTSEEYPGVIYDFPKQVIKMRIGKTIEMPGRKTKLEYQFITPVTTHERVVPVKDTRTAQCIPACSRCCPVYPRCILPKLPFYQEFTNEEKVGIKDSTQIKRFVSYEINNRYNKKPEQTYLNHLEMLSDIYEIPLKEKYFPTDSVSNRINTRDSTALSACLSYSKKSSCWKSYIYVMSIPLQHIRKTADTGLFGIKETSVYMTLSDNFCQHRTSGTQATASINKCFQVSNEWPMHSPSIIGSCSEYYSTCTMSSTLPNRGYRQFIPDNLTHPSVYFFGRKKEEGKQKGMGSKSSQTKLQKTNQTSTHTTKTENKSSKSSLQTGSSASVKKFTSAHQIAPKPKLNLPVKISKGASTTGGTSKTVTIKEEKQQKPCPALGTTKGDMTVTVSHIRIGPKEVCPVHGNEPCQGPKCVLASSGQEQGPVKVTSVNNPRRGVFEVIIRKLTGAPLAKNELMLEWTPPPSRPPTCGGPHAVPCLPSGIYRPSKCKLVVCRPSPCRPKFCRKKACGPIPCRSGSCKPLPCKKCCKSTCFDNPCKTCPTTLCCPFTPCKRPCFPPCAKVPYATPCKSSPCLRPCPVGRKRPRKSRSQPRLKSHRKRISPCCNRSKTCPVVRCRSVPGPCIGCCDVPPFCLPRKCCSVLPSKPPKACASTCSTCCG